ncbi:hypothetical protein B0H10DRAFT_2077065, partial [Mycena sp. CBHHK59/15]
MPPRTRGAGRVRLMALPVNTTGLAALLVETLLEITAHLKTVPVPCHTSSLYCLSCVYLEHLNPLRALSETCKRLRNVFLEQACASTRVS